MIETLLEMPLAARLFIVFVVVVGLSLLHTLFTVLLIPPFNGSRRCRCRYIVTATVRPLSLKFCWTYQVLLGLPSDSLASTYYWKAKLQESSRQSGYFSHGLGARLYGAWLH